MRKLTSIFPALLAVALTLLVGLGDMAHALSQDCAAGHCDSHQSRQDHDALPGHAMEPVAPQNADASGWADSEGCNPYFCNLLAFVPQPPHLGPPAPRLMTTADPDTLIALQPPDSPERPPNL